MSIGAIGMAMMAGAQSADYAQATNVQTQNIYKQQNAAANGGAVDPEAAKDAETGLKMTQMNKTFTQSLAAAGDDMIKKEFALRKSSMANGATFA